jgi:hypothetical protein
VEIRAGELVPAALAEVDRDSCEDGVGRRVARAVFWLPLVGAVLLAATFVHRPVFSTIVMEDGPLEWLQFAGFLAASAFLAVASFLLFRRGDGVGGVLLLIGALGVFGIAGEEISWGQRVLDLETPEALEAANHQRELNLHNVTTFPAQRIGNYLQLVLGAAGLLLPWLTRTRRPRVTNRVLRLLSPPLFVTTCFGLLLAYRLLRFLWEGSVAWPAVVTYGEWPELCFALGMLAYAFLMARGLRGGLRTGTAAPSAGWVAS